MSGRFFAVDAATSTAAVALGGRLPVAALVVSATVLVACIFLMSRALPDLPRWRRRAHGGIGWVTSSTSSSTSSSSPVTATMSQRRGAVTGERPALPAGPAIATSVVERRTVTGPARQIEAAPDALSAETKAVAAERTIEHLLETDPDLVAGIIMQWLQSDRDQHVQRPGRSSGPANGSRR